MLRLAPDRLSRDWQDRYGNPVLVVETFVDPAQFTAPFTSAQGWTEVGLTDGWGRCRRDYYVQHHQPMRLFVHEVAKNARRSLLAEHLKPALVEKKAGARCYYMCGQIKALTDHFKVLPEYRGRVESFPLWSLVTLLLLADDSGDGVVTTEQVELVLEALSTEAGLFAQSDDLTFEALGGLVGAVVGTPAEFLQGGGGAAGLMAAQPLADCITGAAKLTGGGLHPTLPGEGDELLMKPMAVSFHAIQFPVCAVHAQRVARIARRCSLLR